MGIAISKDIREARRLQRIDASTTSKRTFAGKTLLARLHSIHDGDTFNVITRMHKGERYALYSLRLLGIDTPELNPRKNVPHRDLHKKAGHHVTDYLCKQYPPGTIFQVEFVGEDNFGRPLGTVWEVKRRFGRLGRGRNVCDYIISRGWGLPYDGKQKSEFSKEFLSTIVSYDEMKTSMVKK